MHRHFYTVILIFKNVIVHTSVSLYYYLIEHTPVLCVLLEQLLRCITALYQV